MGEEIKIYFNIEDIPSGTTFRTIYDMQIEELVEIRNPSISKSEIEPVANELKKTIHRVYVFFQWRKLVVETVPEEIFIELKTNRNQLLITKEEQSKLYFNNSISIAGMSVGSSILYGLVGTCIAQEFFIADFDEFSNSNLNRVQATIMDVGINKAVVAKQRALELNPFLKINIITTPLNEENIEAFTTKNTSLIFEEIDDFKMKVKLRKFAKNHKKAYAMLTNIVDGVLIDIERHDIEDAEIFNGYVKAETLDKIDRMNELDLKLMKELSIALVDEGMINDRALRTLEQIGNTLVGRPQLYSTVAIDGGIAPYIARRVINGPILRSGRYKFNLSEVFN